MSLSWCLGHFAGRIWVPLRCDGSLLIIKIVLSDSIMKHFHCYDRSLFWDGYALFFFYWACRVIEWLDERTKDVNHILWFSSADHQRNVRQHSPPPTHKYIKSGNIFFWERYFIPSVDLLKTWQLTKISILPMDKGTSKTSF